MRRPRADREEKRVTRGSDTAGTQKRRSGDACLTNPNQRRLLVFLAHSGAVEPINNGSERLLRASVIQWKVTNGYRAMWAAEGEADRRVVRRVEVVCRNRERSGAVSRR